MFPDARFIHIHRNPYQVFQSQRHFFDTAGWYTYLQKPDLEAIDEGILQRHEIMYDAYFADQPLIPKGRIHDIRYDDLVADKVGELAKAYAHLSLEGFSSFEPRLAAYVDSLKGYKRNKFSDLDAKDKTIVAQRWNRSFETWGYPK